MTPKASSWLVLHISFICDFKWFLFVILTFVDSVSFFTATNCGWICQGGASQWPRFGASPGGLYERSTMPASFLLVPALGSDHRFSATRSQVASKQMWLVKKNFASFDFKKSHYFKKNQCCITWFTYFIYYKVSEPIWHSRNFISKNSCCSCDKLWHVFYSIKKST